MTHTTG